MGEIKASLSRLFLEDYQEHKKSVVYEPFAFFGYLSRSSTITLAVGVPLIMTLIQWGEPTLQLIFQFIVIFLWFVPQLIESYLPTQKLIPFPIIYFLVFQFVMLEIMLLFLNYNVALYFFMFLVLRILRAFGGRISLVTAVVLGALMIGQIYLLIGDATNFWYNLLIWTLVTTVVYNRAVTTTQERINRRQTERLLEELKVSHEQLKQYAAQVEQLAAIQERNRIARDIHDSLGHLLMAISVQLEKAMIIFPHEPEKAYRTIEDTRRLAGEALQEVRRSVSTLRSSREENFAIGSDATSFDINEALQKLAARVRENSQLKLEVNVKGDSSSFSNQALITLYRVAQEGLTNIQKYAEASRAQIDLDFGPSSARLIVSDNGKGFAVAALQNLAANRVGGFGLQGLRERLQLIGGHFEIESQLGGGTRLIATLPKVANLAGSNQVSAIN